MANAVDRENLRDSALDYADMTGSAFGTTARINEHLSQGYCALWDMLVDTQEDYFRSETTFTLVAGTEAYALPSDFYRALWLYYVASNRRFKIEKFHPVEIDGYRNSPLSAGSVEMWYVPTCPGFTDDTTAIDDRIQPGWEQYIALEAAIKLRIRARMDPQALMMERGRIEARIRRMLEPRDEGIPDSIADYYGRYENTRHLLRFDERYFKYRIMGSNAYFIEIEYTGI